MDMRCNVHLSFHSSLLALQLRYLFLNIFNQALSILLGNNSRCALNQKCVFTLYHPYNSQWLPSLEHAFFVKLVIDQKGVNFKGVARIVVPLAFQRQCQVSDKRSHNGFASKSIALKGVSSKNLLQYIRICGPQ